jgi:hypothetical protein
VIVSFHAKQRSLRRYCFEVKEVRAAERSAGRRGDQRMDATAVEVATNHVAMVSHPDDVVEIIKAAVKGVPVAA